MVISRVSPTDTRHSGTVSDMDSFEELMVKARLREAYEARIASGCPEDIQGWHKSTDIHGKCCLCGRKIHGNAPRGRSFPVKPDLDLAYEYTYDPDFGNSNLDTWPS